MTLRLTVDSPDELAEKSGRLLESLAKALGKQQPEVADVLEKAAALPRKERVLKFPVTRALERQTTEAYEKTLAAMLRDIAQVLERNVSRKPVLAKSEAPADITKPIHDKQQVAYRRVRNVLRGKGYASPDYEPGGRLYGWSTNQLIELARNK